MSGIGEKIFMTGGVGAFIVGGLFIADKLDWLNMPCIVGDNNECLISTGNLPVVSIDEYGMTSNVKGGVKAFEIKIDRMPLFDTIVSIDTLEISKGNEVEYSASATIRKTTMMSGRLLAIEDETDPNATTYIVSVNDNNTPDNKADDFIEPINLNNMEMYSQVGTNTHTLPIESADEYANCVEQLYADNNDYQGCYLTTKDGDPEAHNPVILDNLYSQYISDDRCIVDTFHVASNLTFGGPTVANGGRDIHPQTKTLPQLAAKAIEMQTASLLGKPLENVVPIIAIDPATSKPTEWIPKDTVDLSIVEAESDGRYTVKAPVVVDEWCLGGSWSNSETPEEERQFMLEEGYVDAELLDAAWYAENLVESPVGQIPAGIVNTRFNADGSIQEQGTSVTTTGS